MERRWRWATEEGNGLEYVAVRGTPQGVVADGVVIGPDSGIPDDGIPDDGIPYGGRLFGCSYTIHCDTRWRVRQVEARGAGGAHLLLRADGAGRWSGPDGAPLPALDRCIDVDLSCTPSPIRCRSGAWAERRRRRSYSREMVYTSPAVAPASPFLARRSR
jgi:hypothetical protein